MNSSLKTQRERVMKETSESHQLEQTNTPSAQPITTLPSALDATIPWGGVRVEEFLGRIKGGAGRIALSGLHGSSLPYLLARMYTVTNQQPIVFLCADNKRAFQMYEELCFFCGEDDLSPEKNVLLYSADEMLPYSEMLPDRSAIQNRLRVLLQLQQGAHPILVVPVAALMRKVMPQEALGRRSEVLQVAEEIDRDALIETLIESGYQRVPVVEDRGTFAVRGELLDIFSPLYHYPARIELEDILVSNVKFFDPDTQRTHHEAEEFLIGPVDETLVNPETLSLARRSFADLSDELDYPTLEREQLLDDLRQGLRPFGLQRLMPGFYESLDSLFDFLPKNAWFVVDEPADLTAEANHTWHEMQRSHDHFIEEGGLAYPPDSFLLSWEQTQREIRRFSRIEHQVLLQLLPKSDADTDAEQPAQTTTSWGAGGALEMPFSTAPQTSLRQQLRALASAEDKRLQPLLAQIERWREERLNVVIVCGARGQALRLQELLTLYQMPTRIWRERFSPELETHLGKDAPVDIFIGRINEGFIFPNARLAILSEEEIFGPKARRQRSRKKGPLSETELESLRKGDLVIHRQYGMARYGGLHTLAIGDTTGDFLLLEYQGKDRLYLPVTRLALLERFTGGGKPQLDRLKGNTFDKKVAKARAAVQALAGNLLQLYAARQAHEGSSGDAPDEAYFEFAARFPFEETPDQWKAIEDVIADVQSARPMDRLICGDVGYGKTEIAMRGAFLAAYQGKQVAVLVPTTVLAQQHYLNFKERFESFPFRIGILSRFQSTKENKETLKQLTDGKIDIIVGTHRLLSKDVHFENLGLLIIDEEHRFGVRHKERIKTLRESVDVLTMTATPIPRTLEMGITGLRDLSLITTPPHDRLAIRTSIAPFNEEVIREAIMRELGRGGQVFFVHNRVQTIGKIHEQLARIVPEARIVVGHGQMQPTELERVMLDFMQGKYNLLLCTSIIESGIDIPRANTILVNRADAFGLAQLYQIRGRVGRGRERAYAVLLVPAHSRISPEAKERLSTLQRFTELGAGFEIARHDLEMRGAGNFLGKEQSGHVHAIGLDLYLDMLEETISEMQGKPRHKHVPTEVKVNVDTYIPDHYVPDVQLRLQCYRRLSSAETPDELDELMEEFCDRFGEPPAPVENLFVLMEITQMLTNVDALSGEIAGGKFRIFFSPKASLNVDTLLQLAQQAEPLLRMLPNSGIELTEALPAGPDCLPAIRMAVRQLPSDLFQVPATEESTI
jgi:transcription-repair coupling factor (superfamily II helicase)